MEKSLIWTCVRQRAGPLVKECRAIRPRLSAEDSPYDRIEKNKILLPRGDSSVCRSRVDRLELRLAMFGWDGMHYTLTFDNESLPEKYRDVRKVWRAFLKKAKRWTSAEALDYIYLIEGKHGDHRYHIHAVFDYKQLPPAVMRYLWKYGEIDEEPVLRGKYDSFRRLAKYFNKEATDGIVIPIGARPWVCSQSVTSRLPEPEVWRDESGVIEIPDDVYSSGRYATENAFGAYYYGWYIESKNSALNLNY